MIPHITNAPGHPDPVFKITLIFVYFSIIWFPFPLFGLIFYYLMWFYNIMRDHSSEKDFQACLKNNINLNALFLLCFRHVLLVMFITFSWVVRTQLACVSPLRTTFKRFEHIDHASNQVDCCSNFQICLICSFFFSPPPFSTFLNCPTSRLSFRPSNLNQKIKKNI